MREIKFRAWLDYGDGTGEMLPNIQNHINGRWAFGYIVNGSVKNVSAPMQYTGLKDKNGVEIYEGDILSGKSKVFGCTDGVVAICEYSDNEGYMHEYHLGWNVCGRPLTDLVNDGLEVIGNIHENPELLK